MNNRVKIYPHKTSDYIYLDIFFEGKRKRPSTGLKKNAKNTKLVENYVIPEIEQQMISGVYSFDGVASKSHLFENFAKEFFTLHKQQVRENTYYEDDLNFKKTVLPVFTGRVLKDIKPTDIEKWQNNLLEKYKAATVSKHRSVFRKMMEVAFKDNLIDENPFRKVSTPKDRNAEINVLDLEDGDDDIDPFNMDELKIMFENFTGYIKYFTYLMALTGMRPSEIIALDWNDIDFEKNRIAVYKAIVKGIVDKPKTKSSIRYVDILPNLKDILLEWHTISPSKEIVFVNSSKKRFFSPNSINKVFKRRLKKFGVKEKYIYQLRHSFASTYISRMSEGVNPLWVSKMLGHKDLSMTLKVYTKFVKETEEKRTENLNKMAHIWHSAKNDTLETP